MPVYDFTEIVDETIASTHPDPAACKIICKMLASNRVDVTVIQELEDSEEACNELYPEDLRPGLIADGTLGWAVVLYLALTELKR